MGAVDLLTLRYQWLNECRAVPVKGGKQSKEMPPRGFV